MVNFWLIIATSIVSAFAGAGAKWLWDRPAEYKRRQKEAREANLRRASAGPFLYPSNRPFDSLISFSRGVNWSPSHGNVLCWFRKEIVENAPAGFSVAMVLENRGEGAQEIAASLEEAPVLLASDLELNGKPTQGMLVLEYPFKREHFGKQQKLLLHLRINGLKDTHTYLLEHGRHSLRRIDPA